MKLRLINICCVCLLALGFTACTDEPEGDNYYTFTGEMISDYISNRPYYSEFKEICQRAGVMDMLATYGTYTCFLPSNEAVQDYLKERGMNSVADLTDADCDTIARTHLVANLYSTFEMTTTELPDANLLGRYMSTEAGVDSAHNTVIYVNKTSHVLFADTLSDGAIIHQNDSVENGIIQPVDRVITMPNTYISDMVKKDESISLFYHALIATGVKEQVLPVKDPTYDKHKPKYYYKSHIWNEVAWVPDAKKFGFTLFIEPDSVYREKFKEYGISTEGGDLRAMYDLACKIYDPVFPNDVNAEGHKFENLTDSVNPLRRFVQYHVMTRYVPGDSKLTADVMTLTKEAFGTDSKLVNPVDWYYTLLPHTMLKIEQLTMNKDENGNDCRGADAAYVKRHFINRRYAAPEYTFRGALINDKPDPKFDGLNGHYFYVDDLVVFSYDVQNIVQNQRIRMDFSTIFPEIMTNDMRLKGNPYKDDSPSTPDDSNVPANGRNFYFPLGYLDGVTFSNNTKVVMRRPHTGFASWQGDEWNLFGDYDFTFRIPPVPYTGEWQLRLGFCAIPTRGVMQVYFDGKPQGIPLDMTKELNSEIYLGDRFKDFSAYQKMTAEEKAEEQKLLKNLGAYRDGRSTYSFNPNSGDKGYFLGGVGTYRRILCQTIIDATKDHYVRFRVASEGKQGNNNEFMLDYFELVPKSVYGVDGDGQMEDDL